MIRTLLAAAALLALAAPDSASASAEPPCPYPVAHRGDRSGGADENSVAAIRQAGRNQVGAEVDVRLSSDGHLILMHDSGVVRVTDGTGLVHERTFAYLRSLHLRFDGDRDGDLDQIPTLAEALRAARWWQVPIVLEVKHLPVEATPLWTDARIGLLADTIAASGWAGATWVEGQVPGEPGAFERRLRERMPPAVRFVWRPEATDHDVTPAEVRATDPAGRVRAVMGRAFQIDGPDTARLQAAGYQVWTGTTNDSALWAQERAQGTDRILVNSIPAYRAWCAGASPTP